MKENYDIEVKLLAITGLWQSTEYLPQNPTGAHPEQLIEYAGRLCWDTTDKFEKNPSRIQEWIGVGHESVIEHASATFYIRASRVFTHELVRHRLASYSQRSQRYVKESKPRYITPPEIKVNSENAYDMFEKAMRNAWKTYEELLQLGVKPEIARYVLPNACETQIVMTMNFRELRHFIKLRTSERALPETRAVANEVLKIMKEQAPKVFEDL
ncbi:MAG: FAD-dependent thymidylate synthase [Dehalococcoidia bacterium]